MIILGQQQQSYEQNVAEGRVTLAERIRKFGLVDSVTATQVSNAGGIDIWQGQDFGAPRQYPWDIAGAPLNYTITNTDDIGKTLVVVYQTPNATFPDIGDKQQAALVLGDASSSELLFNSDVLHVYRAFVVATDGTAEPLAGNVFFHRGSSTNGTVDSADDIRAVVEAGKDKTQMVVFPVPSEEVFMFKKAVVNINFSGGAFTGNQAATCAVRVIQRYGQIRVLEESVDILTDGSSVYLDSLEYPQAVPAGAKIMLSVDSITDTMGFSAKFAGECKHESLFSAEFLAKEGQPGY